uniref:Uncharacterized protein n=1 Tax=Anguilla anguilla TaxID=7936 RepID=A0A0E9RH84_ANGAN
MSYDYCPTGCVLHNTMAPGRKVWHLFCFLVSKS